MRRRTFRPWPRVLVRRARKARAPQGGGVELGQLPMVERPGPHPRVLGTGRKAFPAIVAALGRARRTVEIRAFLWRDDEAGNQVGAAVLDAAERGVVSLEHDQSRGNYAVRSREAAM